MRKIVISVFVSLDGVVEDPGGHDRTARGGWFFEVDRGENGDRFALDEALAADALLLGRRTYEFLSAVWPTRTGAFADRLNAMPKHVVSSTLADPGWNASAVRADDVGELSGQLLVYGSPQLVRRLLADDLVDELRLIVYPVVVGDGERLFGLTAGKMPMRLIGAQTVGDGVAILSYAPR